MPPKVKQIGRKRRDGPIVFADLGGLRQKIGTLASVEPLLAFRACREQFPATRSEAALQIHDEAQCFGGKDLPRLAVVPA